jgi:hypothetical protein
MHQPDCVLLTDRQGELYRTLEAEKDTRPSSFVAWRFVALATPIDQATGDSLCALARKLDPRLVAHVAALWRKCSGVCAYTGRQLGWGSAAERDDPASVATPVKIDDNRAAWMNNVRLVCSWSHKAVRRAGGIAALRRLARHAVKFQAFVQSSVPPTMTVGCAWWDAHECRCDATAPAWDPPSADECARLEEAFARDPVMNTHFVKRFDVDDAHQLARRAVRAYCAQRGRCALTGLCLSRGAQWNSADGTTEPLAPRIDHLWYWRPDLQRNVLITAAAVNSTPSDVTVPTIAAMLRYVVEHDL